MAFAERSPICDGWALSGRFDLDEEVWRINEDFSTRPRRLAKIVFEIIRYCFFLFSFKNLTYFLETDQKEVDVL